MKVGHPWCDLWISPGERFDLVHFEVTFGSACVQKQVKKSELIAQWKILAAQVEEYLRRWDTSPQLPAVNSPSDGSASATLKDVVSPPPRDNINSE